MKIKFHQMVKGFINSLPSVSRICENGNLYTIEKNFQKGSVYSLTRIRN